MSLPLLTLRKKTVNRNKNRRTIVNIARVLPKYVRWPTFLHGDLLYGNNVLGHPRAALWAPSTSPLRDTFRRIRQERRSEPELSHTLKIQHVETREYRRQSWEERLRGCTKISRVHPQIYNKQDGTSDRDPHGHHHGDPGVGTCRVYRDHQQQRNR